MVIYGEKKRKTRRSSTFLLGRFQDLFDLGLTVNDLLLRGVTCVGSSESNSSVDSYGSNDEFDGGAHDISFKKSRAHLPKGQ